MKLKDLDIDETVFKKLSIVTSLIDYHKIENIVELEIFQEELIVTWVEKPDKKEKDLINKIWKAMGEIQVSHDYVKSDICQLF